jgi:hypothetical protein
MWGARLIRHHDERDHQRLLCRRVVPDRAAQESRGAVGSLLVFESGVAASVDERRFAVKAGGGTSGVGGATRGRLEVRQQFAKSVRRHHADRDPKEEQRAARPCGLIAGHGKSVSGCVAPTLLNTPAIAMNRTINSAMTSIEVSPLVDLQSTPALGRRQQCWPTALTYDVLDRDAGGSAAGRDECAFRPAGNALWLGSWKSGSM